MGEQGSTRIRVRIDQMLQQRSMTLTELSQRTGISIVNLSVLKNDRARAIRFTTLESLCDALECTPGDLLEVVPADVSEL
ncbi:putative transcriptional regulator [Microbacteriaceae bacterium MWH-Ta3]|nr:putative transcriptional regulator [Microbacteriaceae bacterium MWH-Ta3]